MYPLSSLILGVIILGYMLKQLGSLVVLVPFHLVSQGLQLVKCLSGSDTCHVFFGCSVLFLCSLPSELETGQFFSLSLEGVTLLLLLYGS